VLASSAIAKGGLAGGAPQTEEGAYEMNLKRLSLLTAVALAVVAYSAVPGSADILSPGQFGSVYSDCDPGGDPQDCPVQGVPSGPATTFTAGSIVITCQTATIDGTMDGNAPATAVLNFSFADCTTQGSVSCSVDDITGVTFNVTEANNPSATMISTETFGTTITCGGVYSCTWSSNPATNPVTIEIDQATQVATIDDTMNVSGSVGCPGSGTGQWQAQYQITDDEDQDLDLWATGTL
jgi:hypothetical protein